MMFTGPSGMKDGQRCGASAIRLRQIRFWSAMARLSSGSSMTRCEAASRAGTLASIPPVGHRPHGAVDAEHLMVARHHLARGAGLALVEQDEVLDDVEQPVMREHPVEQNLGVDAALVGLVRRFHSLKCSHSLVIEP